MLTPDEKKIVKATVPLLETGGEVLITYFYNKLLAEHAEVRPLFNQAHQATGDQPRALANGVLMYAKHIDHLDELSELVTRIINKHVALQVQAEHYPIIGECLLAAIEDVLGAETATPAVLKAWSAAYGQLAQMLIDAESKRYQANAALPGGWTSGRDFYLSRRETESSEITSFYFKPVDFHPIIVAKPGQYIGIKLFINGEEHRRNYSLSKLSDGIEYRISVKREKQGKVSNFLHDELKLGEVVQLFPPSGEFVLTAEARPLVLLSAGVGITPTLPMLSRALEQHRQVLFIHCARNASVQGFAREIADAALCSTLLTTRVCYSEPLPEGQFCDFVGHLGRPQLADWLAPLRAAKVYLLGPPLFMSAMRKILLDIGIAPTDIHYEFFGPARAIEGNDP
ncbi:NO-inducible flavohemoprotein [Pseudomonas sp. PP3]|uniref:NO-inducible flavohemoprotein n=1 Tax=Pseudomonas sp. PP3 TaxID=2815936 RepID=UPI001BAEE5B0|nr:NO-inducible flavohemoprotein [Pseudomonas sp. PP3]